MQSGLSVVLGQAGTAGHGHAEFGDSLPRLQSPHSRTSFGRPAVMPKSKTERIARLRTYTRSPKSKAARLAYWRKRRARKRREAEARAVMDVVMAQIRLRAVGVRVFVSAHYPKNYNHDTWSWRP